MSRDQLVAAPVFVAAVAPWVLLRIRRFALRDRLVAAVANAAVVYPLAITMQWAGADNPAAVGGAIGLGFGQLGWSWSRQVTDDIGHRKEGGQPALLIPKWPFNARFGILFELRYRSRMARDAQSQAWLDEASLFAWNRRRRTT